MSEKVISEDALQKALETRFDGYPLDCLAYDLLTTENEIQTLQAENDRLRELLEYIKDRTEPNPIYKDGLTFDEATEINKRIAKALGGKDEV